MATPPTRKTGGSDTRILLTGVFGPFARDDEYGSRRVNPMELYHNQVTRVQGPFSLRMFHRTFGLLMIEANIDAPCTILEFPTLERFIDEIERNDYDVIGISSIIPNTLKVKKMCEEIRARRPGSTIVVGGHIASQDGLAGIIDADHICRGDGIRWFRKFLGQDEHAPIRHPALISGFGTRIMGLPVKSSRTAAVVIPSVGCPMGCNFCSTSALFGGKGKSITFYETGDELFSVLRQLEKELRVTSFFIMDENFLLYKKRARRLLELMEEHGKPWNFYVFSSARVIRSYSMDELVRLGISWVWMGLEGEESRYEKLRGVDTLALVKDLQSHGICVLGSTIIGLEEHTPDTIGNVIDYAVRHATDFHQFMLYTPLPGTPLYREHLERGELFTDDECPAADTHGQERFNFRHRHIRDGSETSFLLGAFTRDLEVNGPSLARITRTRLAGWKRYRSHPDRRIAARVRHARRGLGSVYAGSVWAMTRFFEKKGRMMDGLRELLEDLYGTFGPVTRCITPLIGRFLLYTITREQKRLDAGWTYEPPVIYEKNDQAIEVEGLSLKAMKKRIGRIGLPVYDFHRALEDCRAQMEEVRTQMAEYRERAAAQLAELRRMTMERSALAAEQAARIRVRMDEKLVHAGKQLDNLRDNLSCRYTKLKRQIEDARSHAMERCREMHSQVEEACLRLEESFLSGKQGA